MIDNTIAIKQLDQWFAALRSDIFKGSIQPFADNIRESLKKKELDKAVDEAKKSVDQTIADLSDKQAEAIIFENIFLGLINYRIDNEDATEMLTDLGYHINPNPLAWLKQKLSGLRNWIIDAIKWLRTVGQSLGLTVKEISVEIGITPKVTITFITIEDKT
jgi:hypothetical protein